MSNARGPGSRIPGMRRLGTGRLGVFVSHELRMQLRSLRFQVIAGGAIGAASLPAIVILARRHAVPAQATTYLAETLLWLVPLTIFASFVLAADGLLREREQGTWSTLSLCDISSAGYVVGRWIGLLLPLLVISLLPMLIAGGLATASAESVPWADFVVSWLLRVAPGVVLWSAIGLGFGTVGSGLFAGAALFAFAVLLANAVLNQVLFAVHLHLAPPMLEVTGLLDSARRMQAALGETSGPFELGFPIVASAAPFDARAHVGQALGPLGPTAGLAAFALAWTVLLLRRTRPDVQPWRVVKGHPLRNFILLAGRLRERFAWDAGLGAGDRVAVAAALGCALLAVTGAIVRDARLEHEATERFAVEGEPWPGPTDRALALLGCQLKGHFDGDGEVRLASTLEFHNLGQHPQRQLSLELSPSLRLELLQAPGLALHWRRRAERIAVTLDPPLPPGGVATVSAVVSGMPQRTVFALPLLRDYGGVLSFHRAFERYRQARFSNQLVDLTGSFTVRAISPARVELKAPELMPAPRYTPYELVAGGDDEGPGMRGEEALAPVSVAVEIAAPPALWLADACGNVAVKGRLSGHCALPLSSYGVRGGPQVAERSAGLILALLPGHRELARLRFGELEKLGAMAREVWPDDDLLSSTVLVEVPGEEAFLRQGTALALFHLWRSQDDIPLAAQGRLLLIPEVVVLYGNAIGSARLVAKIVGARMLERRRLAVGEELLFRELVEGLAMLRAGFGPRGGALLPRTNGGSGWYQGGSLLTATAAQWPAWRRLPPLLVDLSHRIGEDAVRRGLAAFVARPGASPGTIEELVGEWKRAGAKPLDNFWRDYFVGAAVPTLVLKDVVFTHGEGGWRVRGQVVNSGTGEAQCPVVLSAETTRSSVEVTVPAAGSAPFAFALAAPPRAVLLDPEHQCYRYPSPLALERVDYRGGAHD